MSARDDYRALASWSGAPFGAAVMEARRALDEIDQLRADVETVRTAYQRDLQGLRDERDDLLARRDEVMRLSGEQVRRSAALVDAVRVWSRTPDARGGAHDRLQDAWDDYTLERRSRWDQHALDAQTEPVECEICDGTGHVRCVDPDCSPSDNWHEHYIGCSACPAPSAPYMESEEA